MTAARAFAPHQSPPALLDIAHRSRSLFIVEPDRWRRTDASSIEFRIGGTNIRIASISLAESLRVRRLSAGTHL